MLGVVNTLLKLKVKVIVLNAGYLLKFFYFMYLAFQIRKIEAALEYPIFKLTPTNAQSSVGLLPLYELYMQ